MLPRSSLAVLILFILVSGCASNQSSPESDFVVGVWSSHPQGLVEVRKKGRIFQLIQLSERRVGLGPGDLIAEFKFDKGTGEYTGRHKWSEGRGDPGRWGREGGLRIERIDDEHFLLVFLDSIYTGGWTFSKIVPSSGHMPSGDMTYLSCEYAEVLVHEMASRIARLTPPSSALFQDEALYFFDVEKIREIAIQAVHDKYPDIPPGGLVSLRSIHMGCHSTRVMPQFSGLGKEIPLCIATTSITVKSTFTEEKYITEDGECRIAESYESISVDVYPDGRARVGSRGSRNSGGHSVDCTKEFDSLFE